jgi:hypothetical protein
MKLKDLTEQHIIEVLRLYEEYCGFERTFRETMYTSPGYVMEQLKTECSLEYRIGSKWDGQSKIYFDVDFQENVSVAFNSNFDPRDRKGKDYQIAEKKGKEFVKVAMQYLNNQ